MHIIDKQGVRPVLTAGPRKWGIQHDRRSTSIRKVATSAFSANPLT
jgi:hypothetical protein